MYILWNFSEGWKVKNSVSTCSSDTLSTTDHTFTVVWSNVSLCDHRDKSSYAIAERSLLKCNINTEEEMSFKQLVSTNTTTDSEILKKNSHVQQSPYYLIIFTGTRSSPVSLQCLMGPESLHWQGIRTRHQDKHIFKPNITQNKGCIKIENQIYSVIFPHWNW